MRIVAGDADNTAVLTQGERYQAPLLVLSETLKHFLPDLHDVIDVGVGTDSVTGDAEGVERVGEILAGQLIADVFRDGGVAIQALFLADFPLVVYLVVGIEAGDGTSLVAAHAELFDGVVGAPAQKTRVVAGDDGVAFVGIMAGDAGYLLLLKGQVGKVHLPGPGAGDDPEGVVFNLLMTAAAHGSGVPLAAEGDFLSSLGGVPVAGETEDLASVGIDVDIVDDVEGISFPESGEKQGGAVNLMATQTGDGRTGSVSPGEVAPVDAIVTLPAEAPHSGRPEREGGRQT
jgi:hypothetical protein